VAPTADSAVARKPGNGACGENELAALTDLERKIMRLVACGMSNKEIARQLKVATGTIKARVDYISAQFEIKNRTELATFALSRLYGGVGALAALIWAALDDVQSASARTVHHAHTDSVTVMAANDTGAVVTIKISSPKTTAASGKTAKAVGKADRVENSVADIATRGSKLIESRADIAASTIASPTLNPSRSSMSDFGAFMLMAVGASIYGLLNSPAQAFTFCDSVSDDFASAAANATSELGANMSGSADANLNGFENVAWLNPEVRHKSFVFEANQGDAIGRGDDLQIVGADASEHSVDASGNPHVGSGAVDAPIDLNGFKQAAPMDASRNAEHGAIHATAVDGSNDEQSQRDLHVSEEGAAAGKPHAEEGPPGHDPDHGQSQRDLDVSEESAAAGKQHAKHDSTGHGSARGQLRRDLHASEEGSATADQHVKDDVLTSHSNPSHSQADLHKAPINGSKTLHAGPSQNADGNAQAIDGSSSQERAAAPQFGDSFHFKNDRAEVRASENCENGHGPDGVKYALHTTGNNGLAVIQDADLTGPSHAVQCAPDHARVEHHLTHDLFV
jgi:DNA-binding CsgD family transcriptional regulator